MGAHGHRLSRNVQWLPPAPSLPEASSGPPFPHDVVRAPAVWSFGSQTSARRSYAGLRQVLAWEGPTSALWDLSRLTCLRLRDLRPGVWGRTEQVLREGRLFPDFSAGPGLVAAAAVCFLGHDPGPGGAGRGRRQSVLASDSLIWKWGCRETTRTGSTALTAPRSEGHK